MSMSILTNTLLFIILFLLISMIRMLFYIDVTQWLFTQVDNVFCYFNQYEHFVKLKLL